MAAPEKLCRRRITSSRSTATEATCVIHKNIHVSDPQDVAESFAAFFASILVNENGHPALYEPRLTKESHSTMALLPRKAHQLLLNKN